MHGISGRKAGRDKGVSSSIAAAAFCSVRDDTCRYNLTMTAHKPPAMSSPPGPAPPAPPAPPGKARLLYCKAHVAIHPTAFKRDNIPGYLGLVDAGAGAAPTRGVAGEGLLVSWVPEQVLARMDAADREGYRRAGEMAAGEREEDGECALAGGC